ncbi:LamB/YcsF family protein [bacterium]|nr:LamB/YcsF family protein [Akkermansiaceae bacterium]MDB4257782.1 LamB/YcsF family protein [bacterium]
MTIDLNVDLGEGGANDETLTALASSVNIACGGHAGDDETMVRAVELALLHGSAIGAHPSYDDPENFGRRALDLPLDEVTASVARQVAALAQHADLHHVKPHGALYNQAQNDPDLAHAIIVGISQILPSTLIYTLPQGALAQAALNAGHRVAGEGFIDRGYQSNGQLIPRSEPGALLDGEAAIAQARRLAQRSDIATLCVHSDSPEALHLLKKVRESLSDDLS